MSYSHMANATLPSALSGFTSEFEMGSGGSHSLMSSGNSFAAYSSLSIGFCPWKQVAPLRSTPQILNYSMNEVAVLFKALSRVCDSPPSYTHSL